ncbi:transposase [Lysobacter sp. CFH 32150]|nr:transposase [Lysobacter sp. CFH 32150]
MGRFALRKGRWSITGQIYHVTFRTAGSDRHFASWTIATDAARFLAAPSGWRKSRLLAWVLMPDHWHGMVALGGNEPLSICIGRLKGASARHLRQTHPGLGRIWAAGYYDRALRSEDDLLAAARYLVMNPIRAGTCKKGRRLSVLGRDLGRG